MSRLLISLSALVLLASPAAAQSVKMLIVKPGFVDNEFIYGRGKADRTTPIVIPQTGTPGTNGWGLDNPEDKVTGVHGLGRTATIVSFSEAAADTGSLITTATYGTQSVYTAEVSDLTIRGPYNLGAHPFNNETVGNDQDPTTAVKLDAMQSIVKDCEISGCTGPAVKMVCTNANQNGLWAREYRVAGNVLHGNFVGIEACADMRISDNLVENNRDENLHIPANTGSVQSTGNHYYGGQKSIYLVNAGGFHSTNDVFSDSFYGMHLTGNAGSHTITNGFSQHCNIRNIDCECADTSFLNQSVIVTASHDGRPDIVGVEIANRGIRFTGHVTLSGYTQPGSTNNSVNYGSTAFKFTNDGYNSNGPSNNTIEAVVTGATYTGGSSNYDTAVNFLDAGTGNHIDITIPYAFATSNCRLLVIASGQQSGMKHNVIHFRGEDLQGAVASPGSFVDIASGGIDSTNIVTITDTDSGATVTLTAGATY